ncbi:hypothetical protein LAJ19_03060 [Deinococcus taeanensis]|uniref:hypothetical protein n=1 Tax=Deinococcus taeanensis TaxID=2737050 RepID=UPI001CDB54CE|nr:hypothetical protein [Deinococcus taeanensis]UBV43213.1 hypothetical protein LAJ19_03060 [Deinococcus taeanensis]
MSELKFLLAALAIGALIFMAVTMRSTARRMHYRDRPRFWRTAAPLLIPALLSLGMVIWGVTRQTGSAVLWGALVLGAVNAGVAWWMNLNPRRLLQAAHRGADRPSRP